MALANGSAAVRRCGTVARPEAYMALESALTIANRRTLQYVVRRCVRSSGSFPESQKAKIPASA
jgi:hypothetical protein